MKTKMTTQNMILTWLYSAIFSFSFWTTFDTDIFNSSQLLWRDAFLMYRLILRTMDTNYRCSFTDNDTSFVFLIFFTRADYFIKTKKAVERRSNFFLSYIRQKERRSKLQKWKIERIGTTRAFLIKNWYLHEPVLPKKKLWFKSSFKQADKILFL